MPIPLRTQPNGDRFHYERALKKLKEKKDVQEVLNLELELACQNPVGAMPKEAFLMLLRAVVQSHCLATGDQPTKTFMEMKAGLDVLAHGKPPARILTNSTPFDWEYSLGLLGPLTAFVYQRMHAELKLARAVELPDLSLVQVQQDADCVHA